MVIYIALENGVITEDDRAKKARADIQKALAAPYFRKSGLSAVFRRRPFRAVFSRASNGFPMKSSFYTDFLIVVTMLCYFLQTGRIFSGLSFERQGTAS